jgi:hypothetical protein
MRRGILATFIAAAVLHACSDDTTSSTPTTDGGAESSTPIREGGSLPEEDAAKCDPSADITAGLADASIADSSTSGICLGCIATTCKTQLDTCVADCTCQFIAGRIFECLAKNGDTLACRFIKTGPGGSPINDPAPEALISCFEQQCASECANDDADAGAPVDAGDGG